MILADTSVWVDHLRAGDAQLSRLLGHSLHWRTQQRPALLGVLAQAPAMLFQGLQRGAPRQGADLGLAGQGQLRADETADRAGADDADLHGFLQGRTLPGFIRLSGSSAALTARISLSSTADL